VHFFVIQLIFLWFGFIGVKFNSSEIKYIYNFNYNMKLMQGVIKKQKEDLYYQINPAFWPALLVEED